MGAWVKRGHGGFVLALLLGGCARASERVPAPEPQQAEPQVQAPAQPVEPAAPKPASTTPPALSDPKTLTLPQVVERRLDNGLRILVVEHHELPIADFVLIVKSGSEEDPARREGLASLTSALLDEGTRTRDALGIADQIGYLGVSLTTASGWDASRVALHTPTAQLDSALALFADVIRNPSFAAKELERLRKDRLTAILQQRDRAPVIADLAFSSILYGEDHPYGRAQQGTEPSVKAITRADVQRFYNQHYRPNNSVLLVVGDVNANDIVVRANRLFGSWQRGTVPATRVRESKPAGASTTVYLIDKPGAPQSSFRIGSIGVPRATPDYFPLLVMNTILGGSFTSRLNNNLRETRGYTYGAGSSFDMRQEAGPFTARAEIVAAKSDSALIEFMKELRNIREAVPAQELDKAKRYLQLGLPAQFETTGDIAFRLAPVAIYDLPLDYFNSYAEQIAEVGAADVERVARQYVRPDNMSIVIVGDLKTIEQGIRAVQVGKVEVRDMSGRPIVQ
jgi:predicted Zn-dependent peptidase